MQIPTALFSPRMQLSEAEFDRLFLDLYPTIAAAAYRLVGDQDEAEELAAEAFWKLWQTPPAHRENLAGWLYRAVINLSYNRLRSYRRRMEREVQAGQFADPRNAPPTPQEMAERSLERQQVRAVLRDLPERDVQLLTLHAVGLSYKEIAAALKINPASIGTLIARAEQKFESRFRTGG